MRNAATSFSYDEQSIQLVISVNSQASGPFKTNLVYRSVVQIFCSTFKAAFTGRLTTSVMTCLADHPHRHGDDVVAMTTGALQR